MTFQGEKGKNFYVVLSGRFKVYEKPSKGTLPDGYSAASEHTVSHIGVEVCDTASSVYSLCSLRSPPPPCPVSRSPPSQKAIPLATRCFSSKTQSLSCAPLWCVLSTAVRSPSYRRTITNYTSCSTRTTSALYQNTPSKCSRKSESGHAVHAFPAPLRLVSMSVCVCGSARDRTVDDERHALSLIGRLQFFRQLPPVRVQALCAALRYAKVPTGRFGKSSSVSV